MKVTTLGLFGTAKQILQLLVEGVGINATARIIGGHKETILKILALAGERCLRLLDERVRNVYVDQVQVDEIWSFVHCKQKHIRPGTDDSDIGDQYTYVAMDRDSKLVISFVVGKRDAINAYRLMVDLSARLANRAQITTDGFRPYIEAVESAFGIDVDFAQLVKIYAGNETDRERYSPSE